MASEMVKQVLAAESASDAKLAKAREECAQILADADTASQQALQEQTAAAQKEGAKLQTETEEKIRQYRQRVSEECAQEKAALQQNAEKNMDAAANAVFMQLFGPKEGG